MYIGRPFQVYSEVHRGIPCNSCILCKETYPVYTHPILWKTNTLLDFLKGIEPQLNVSTKSCICRHCRDSLLCGLKNPGQYHPRWKQHTNTTTECQVPSCDEPASRHTQMADKEAIQFHLKCGPLSNNDSTTGTSLCDKHYRALHKEVKPSSYQWKCAVCSMHINGTNYHTFRACTKPELFQTHLEQHTGFDGTLSTTDKLCKVCYRHSLTVAKLQETKRISIFWKGSTRLKVLCQHSPSKPVIMLNQ